MIDFDKAEKAVKMLLEAIGEDPNREGLIDTPKRVAKMYEEVLSGYKDDAKTHLSKVFNSEKSDIVLEKDISFFSMCEHHLMPFFGKVHIAYIPRDKVVGLSKLGRVVDVYAKRLQLQEQMTVQIANSIVDELSPLGVMVVVEGEHTCMTMRGVKKVGSKTTTVATRGQFEDDVESRNMVLNLIK